MTLHIAIANLVWCLRFPEPEEEIRVNKDYMDTDYGAYILKLRQKLVRSKVGWMLFLFPERADAESPPKHSWNAELNSAIQKIMNGLPTPMIGLEDIEKAIAGPSLGETTQEDTSSEGDFDFNFLYCPASWPLVEQEFDDWNPCIEYEDFGEESPLINVEENVQGTVAAKVAAKRYPTSDAPLHEWAGKDRCDPGYREEYLLELLRLEGRGGEHFHGCMSCSSPAGIYRCEDCLGPLAECLNCTLKRHRQLPLHIIKKWDGACFDKVSLKDLGLRVQLGHPASSRCVAPQPGHKDFMVLHTNGLHYVAVDFCGCDNRISNQQQLLRSEWFPATVHQPQTCATFRLLETFHVITLAGKLSAHEYYKAMEYLTDNTELNVPKTRYKSFMQMIRMFRHLKLMKRAGRGNIQGGLIATGAGDLAPDCPTCPVPGVNLPANWKDVDSKWKFLYLLIIAMDANFRLKNLMRSSIAKDPGLHTGMAYFPDDKPYREHVLKYATQKDISNCSGFKTLAHTETKFSTGLRSTGVGMALCARHEIVRGGGVADLQKGERYCNMDYILLSALAPLLIASVFVSYDIACQFKLKFDERVDKLPPEIQLPPNVEFEWGIPKCHCPMHKVSCQAPHSLNFKNGVGRTDGEGIECSWSELNHVVNSTKEMGPGSHHDTLDDHIGHHNFRKYIGLGRSLHSRLVLATAEEKRQQKIFEDFSASLTPEVEKQWTDIILRWENDPKQKNPYVSIITHASQDEVKKQLLKEEAIALKVGVPQLHDTSQTGFITLGLLVEENQRRICWDARKPNQLTTNQDNEIQHRRLLLLRQLKHFRNLQVIYMPLVTSVQAQNEESWREQQSTNQSSQIGDSLTDVEHQVLWLPSTLPENHRKHSCDATLIDIEIRLRRAQCEDMLDKIRSLQRGHLSFISFRNRNIRNQNPNTRAQDTISRLEDKSKALAVKYRAARKALLALLGPGDWETHLQELKDGDLTTPDGHKISIEDPDDLFGPDGHELSKRKRADIKKGLGQGKKIVSWIWTTPQGVGDESDEVLHKAVRVEWAKARTRHLRWWEEAHLLREEMRRIRKTLEWRAAWWEDLWKGWEGLDEAMMEGVNAYASRQANMQHMLRTRFSRLWDKPMVPIVRQEDSGEGPYASVDPILEELVEDDDE
ncbi:uncharacterized protein LACBIDRAFT_323718 [Laccaria bicolor S238N-H82]|uniref:Predicted protein n=1 Tax=Laccaria bicolor (strain S238N-H82 / ATCC MYA-4686) TaxID=486041 RepID=B0CYK1_LACBS|nr:uncharacterized protein LACBIDRAFT_323718 [Laccaria bicolor S238N-H82]EDR12898.1 predicted protein [Laccaria bicolor S238N-H82]|eukprot:XP_001877162.1 predicted protein [Laccaria bicolor S238N-H82]